MKEIEWNKCLYIDCMDKEKGLPSLPDKSIDLCFSDIAWGVNYDNYKDDYNFDWYISLFNELKRVCKGIILELGGNSWMNWIAYEKPKRIFYWYRNNSCKIYHLDYFLCYGNIKRIMHIREVIPLPIPKLNLKYIHETPKPLKLFYYILKKLKPESVIDPFIGSGTTAEVCTKLGIKWLGYEINEVYSQDINKRLLNCKKEPQQIALERYIK